MQKSVAAYGCFVDIGTTTDGLVHISQLSHEYVQDINDFVSPGQKVKVVLMSVENDKKLALSMKQATPSASTSSERVRAYPLLQCSLPCCAFQRLSLHMCMERQCERLPQSPTMLTRTS
jgi:predicted RNA-binding protein with RPS1 domain